MAHTSEHLLCSQSVMHISVDQHCSNDSEKEINSISKVNITSLPLEVLQHILGYFSFGNISKLRLVSKSFDNACADLLNCEFHRLKAAVLQRYNYLKSQLPRRESSRRKHPLARENDIIETVHMRLALLNLTLGKHMEKNYCCFFAGEVLDEVNRLLCDLKINSPSPSYKITDELFDLSTMAVEYFKDHIEPVLPQVSYISELLEKSMGSTAKMDSCIKETNKTCTQEIPALKELNKSLRTNRRNIEKNRRDINFMKLSLKNLNHNINNLESMMHQIRQQQKECKEIALPKNYRDELLLKLVQCNLMIESFETGLPGYQQSKQKKSKSSSTVDSKACRQSSGTMHCAENSQSEKILRVNGIGISSPRSHSFPINQEEIFEEPLNSPSVISKNICSSKRKCEVIPRRGLFKKKKIT